MGPNLSRTYLGAYWADSNDSKPYECPLALDAHRIGQFPLGAPGASKGSMVLKSCLGSDVCWLKLN